MNDIILLHGALGSSEQLIELDELLQDTFNVHRINFSGHGGLPVPNDGFSMELFERDITNYMESRKIESAFFFGYSMGGYVALSYFKKNPQRVKSIFTLATKFDWNPESAKREISFLDPEKTESRVPQFARQLEKCHEPSDWKLIMKLTSGFITSLGNDHLESGDFNMIQCPVRLAVGDRDKMVSIEATHAVYKELPLGSLLVMPCTPHPIELCDTSRLANELKQFFVT